MRLNSRTTIAGNNVILVPYRKMHVEKYHSWMEDENLREATCSDLLTLEEEYEMQKLWLDDEYKCTFIILQAEETQANEIDRMIGDVNLFLSADDSPIAECSIMIAEEQARGMGCGYEALKMMLKYGCDYLNVRQYVAKISYHNFISRRLFDKVKFVQGDYNAVFDEYTYSKVVDNEWVKWLHETTEWNIKIE